MSCDTETRGKIDSDISLMCLSTRRPGCRGDLVQLSKIDIRLPVSCDFYVPADVYDSVDQTEGHAWI